MSYQGLAPKANRLRLQPRSADPVNPAEGDIFYSDGTPRAEGVWFYKDGGWLQVASSTGNKNVRSVTTTDTATPSDDVLVFSGSSFTETLFSASGNGGKILYFIHVGTTSDVYTIIAGADTHHLYNPNDVLALISDGSVWRILSTSVQQTAELYVDASPGVGSTNTKVRRFTNTRKNTLSSYATYADSATLGASVTINVPGFYSIFYSDFGNAGNDSIGITVNAIGTLTTNVSSMTYAQGKRAVSGGAGSGGYGVNVSTTLYLEDGDVIRPQLTGVTGTSDNIIFSVKRIGY